jgi:hypothetical protein
VIVGKLKNKGEKRITYSLFDARHTAELDNGAIPSEDFERQLKSTRAWKYIWQNFELAESILIRERPV